MILINSLADFKSHRKLFDPCLKLGFVPTMGYLHEGHLSLVRESNNRCDITIVSIYVNPSQFGANEDLSSYPRDLNRDLELLSKYKVDYVFFPTTEEIYPTGYKTWVEVSELSDILCGASRPGHFKGVATIVLKLINLVRPHMMFMGSKDFQQVMVLKTMLHDLNLDTEIISCPIIRESDGLAMSSRNSYLDPEQRQRALCLSKAIKLIQTQYKSGIKDIPTLCSSAEELIAQAGARTDYLQIVNSADLSLEQIANDDSRIIMAVFIDKIRLIDNSSIIDIQA